MIGFIFTLAVVASLLFMAYHLVKKFREAEGTVWERLLAGGRDSATILWGYLLYLAGAILDLIERMAVFLNMPEVTTFVNTHVPPKYVAGGMMVIGIITIAARLRSILRGAV